MATITSLEGFVESAGLDPLGTVRGYTPRGKNERPHARYGKRGIYVIMAPIPGLTPAGVFKDEKPFAFQAPPTDSFGEDGSYNHQDYATVSAGQHTTPVGRELRTCQFQTIFLDWEAEWTLAHDGSGVYPAQHAVKELGAIRDHGKPFHLVAHQSNFQSRYEIDYAATLRSVHWEIRAGEIDTYYVTVQFSEFSTPDIQEFLSQSAAHPSLPASLATARLPGNRNTLQKLARFYYGDPSKWRVIAAANGITGVGINTVLTPGNTHRSRITVPVLKKKKKATRQHR